MRYLLLFFFVLSGSLCAYAQERDSIRLDSVAVDTVLQDSIKLAQDTVKKESRKERRARERAEAEREKYYYKGIKKDSARLEIERLSRVAWKRSLIVPGWGQYTNQGRLEERRVGKGWRSREARYHSSRRRHTRFSRDWSSDVCSSDLYGKERIPERTAGTRTGRS